MLVVVLVALAAGIIGSASGVEHADHDSTLTYVYEKYSLTKPYMSSGFDIPHWDTFGSTLVSSNVRFPLASTPDPLPISPHRPHPLPPTPTLPPTCPVYPPDTRPPVAPRQSLVEDPL